LYPNPKALVAAKKLYFGVGGGVDFFHAVLKERAGERIKVVEKADVTDEGVGRVVWEVELTGRRA
jgi:protein-histidine N-methyltransferase